MVQGPQGTHVACALTRSLTSRSSTLEPCASVACR
jgi:hypothetical protein